MLKHYLIAVTLLKVVVAQCPLQSYSSKMPIEIATSSIVEALTGRVTPRIPVPSTPLENIILCRNLAAQIESTALAKLKRNALKRPVFGQIAGPLLKEIAMACRCPVCQGTNSHIGSALSSSSAAAVNPNLVFLNSVASTPNSNINRLNLSYY